MRIKALHACGVAMVMVSWWSNVQAANGTWSVDAGGNWSSPTNWTLLIVPGLTAGDTAGLTFDITAARTITLDTASRTLGTLNIGDSAAPYFAYTLTNSGGASLTFNNGGSRANLVQTATTAADIISAPITLSDNLGVSNNSALTLSGVISGTKTIAKSGIGTLTLSGVNTFTGGMTNLQGTVSVGMIAGANIAQPLGAIASVTLGSSGQNATLEYSGPSVSVNLPFIFAAGGTGTFQIDNASTILTRGGVALTGGGGLIKSGAGTLQISSLDDYSGNTTVNAGILRLDTSSNPNTTYYPNGGILVNNAGTFNRPVIVTANGSGLDGISAASYSGTLTSSGGNYTLNINASSVADSVTIAGTVTPGSGLTLLLDVQKGSLILGNSTAFAANMVSLQLESAATLDMNKFNAVFGALSGSGTVSDTGGGGGATSVVTLGGTNSATFSGLIENGTKTTALVRTNTGTQTLSGPNTFTGGSTIKGGTVQIGVNNVGTTSGALGPSTAAVTLGDTTGSANASLLTAGAFTFANAVTVASGSSGSATLGGGTADTSIFTGNITLNKSATFTAVSGGTVTFSGIISGSGFGITKTDAGTVTLSRSNTYTGGTAISAGTLKLGTNNAMPSAGALTLNGGIFSSQGFSNTVGALTLQTSSAIVLGTNTATLTFASGSYTAGTLTISNWTGTAGQSGTANKIFITAAPSTTFLTNINFAGYQAGAVRLGTGEIVPSGALTATKLAITSVNGGSNPTAGTGFNVVVQAQDNGGTPQNVIANTAVTLSLNTGAGTLGGTLTGTITAGSSSVTISGVTYDKAESGVILTATRTSGDNLTAGNSSAFTVNHADANWNVDASGNWSASGNWTPAIVPGIAAGDTVGLTYNITAARTVTMDTASRTVGTLNIGDSGSSYFGYTLTNSGGATLTFNNNGGTANLVQATTTATDIIALPISLSDNLSISNGSGLTLSKEIGGAKNITKLGAGILTLSGTNTYSGVTTISAGFLRLQNASGLGSTAGGTVVANGATLDVLSGYTMTEPLTLNGDGAVSVGALRNLNPVSLAWNELITLASSSRINCQGSGGTLTFGGATGGITGTNVDLTFGGSPSSGNVIVNRPIALGTGNLILSGTGTLSLNATNTFNGLTITSGTVQLGAPSVIPDTSMVTNNATFAMQGFSQTIGGLSGSGSVTGAGANLLTVNVASGSVTFSGAMSAGALTKSGVGTQVLSGTNTYTGGTTVSAGTLSLGSSNVLADTGALIMNGGTFANSGYSDTLGALTNQSSSTIALGTNTTGTLTFASASYVAGTLTISNWTGTAGQSGTANRIFITADPGATLLANINFTGYPNGATRLGTGEIVPSGPTKLAITSVNSGSSPTAGTAFNVVVQAQDSGGTPRNVVADTAVTLSLNTGSGTLGGTLTGTIAAGTSSVTISGATYTKAESGVVLTATRTSGDSLTAGNSSSFTVNPGALHHFAFAAISTQTYGSPFNVSITAQDANNNTVTSFAGTVDLSTTAGTISPTVSGTFSGGTRTESVTVTLVGSGKTITATRSGGSETGTSASFTVNKAGSANAVSSSANPSPTGSNMTFTATLTAISPASGTPTGSVQFRADGTALGSPAILVSGVASLTTASLSHGTHTITAEYAGDGNFIGSTNSLSPNQIINTRPAAANDTAQRYVNSDLKIRSAILLINDTDADGDSLTIVSVSSTSAAGGTVAVSGPWIRYTPSAGFTNSDSFSYVIADTGGLQATGSVSVVVLADNSGSQNIAAIENLENNSSHIRFAGIPGRTYTIQYTTNLVTPGWVSLTNLTADTIGLFDYTDTLPQGASARFYRSTVP